MVGDPPLPFEYPGHEPVIVKETGQGALVGHINEDGPLARLIDVGTLTSG